MRSRTLTRRGPIVIALLAASFGLGSNALSLAAPPRVAARHQVFIEVRGALAFVTVERPLAFQPEAPRASDEVVLDLDLPAGARWVGAEVRGSGFTQSLQVPRTAATSSPYAERLRARGLRPRVGRLDDAVDFRLRVAHASLGRAAAVASSTLRLRFLAPLACVDGRFVLRMPGPLDPEPAPAHVTARVLPGPGNVVAEATLVSTSWSRRRGAAEVTLRGRAPARAAWELSFRSESARGGSTPFQALATTLRRGGAGRDGTESALAVCAAAARPTVNPPGHLIVLLDRSRSVGAAGISLERDAIRALLEALPPSLPFNVVTFDRSAQLLFPTSRAATREALQAIDEAATPGSLANGTELTEALRVARGARERHEAAGGPTWWILVTDGAVPEHLSRTQMREASPRSEDGDRAGILVVRSAADESPNTAALRLLAEVPLAVGGVLRELREPQIASGARSAVQDLQWAGDLLDPRLVGAGIDRQVAVALAPGDGRFMRVEGSLEAGVEVRARFAGRGIAVPIIPAAFPREWAPVPRGAGAVLLEDDGPDHVASLEPGSSSREQDPVVRGQMDRGVVRNALSLAFLPRARACYLTRPVRSAEDKALAGRLRLELHLERGELTDARVTRSTLGRSDIEDCLRRAAFAVEIPRAMFRDAPIEASLNLVFQPLTPSAVRPASADDDVDLILGPLPSPSDPLQLLEGRGSGGGAPAEPKAGGR